MKDVVEKIREFAAGENGVASIEYALLASLIAVVCILTVLNVGTRAQDIFTRVCNEISKAISGAATC